MKEVLDYWKNNYSWRESEEILNQFSHFKTNIEGIDVHFIHVKPKRSTGNTCFIVFCSYSKLTISQTILYHIF